MNQLRIVGFALAALAVSAVTGNAQAREQIRIVGSSTVYPFSSYVAEDFGATTDHPTPVVESTGSGGGMKLFCQGTGMETPDITNASRAMKPSEYRRCQNNGVTDITELMVGFDGIVLANHVDAPRFELTREQITLAVAAEVPEDGQLVKNPNQYWDDISADLPHKEIRIYGPPTTSGTRDAFEELVMEAATEAMAGYGGEYTKIRQDGAYVPAGENDNLIVQKLTQDRGALGIFGYGFLEENTRRVQASLIEGVAPEPDTISSGEYPVSRSLYFYVKHAHLGKVPGMETYVNHFLAENMIGELGFLKEQGLIPLPTAKRDAMRARVADWQPLTRSDLK